LNRTTLRSVHYKKAISKLRNYNWGLRRVCVNQWRNSGHTCKGNNAVYLIDVTIIIILISCFICLVSISTFFYLGYSSFFFFIAQKNSYFTTTITALVNISVKDFFHWKSLSLYEIPEYQAVLVLGAVHTRGWKSTRWTQKCVNL